MVNNYTPIVIVDNVHVPISSILLKLIVITYILVGNNTSNFLCKISQFHVANQ